MVAGKLRIITGITIITGDMNITPKKSLGQHWLHDQAALTAICEAAEIRSGDTILEIGAGLGTLSSQILTYGVHLIAVEYDETLVAYLRDEFQTVPDIAIEQADIRGYDFSVLPESYKIVANIPYYLTAYLLRILSSEQINRPSRAVLLVQEEVAQRVCAQPGQSSVLSLSVQYYYEATLGQRVAAQLFTPPPKVNSQILCMSHRSQPLFNDVNSKDLFQIIKIGFSHRRKTLVNNLSAGLHLPRQSFIPLLEAAHIPITARAQQLSIEQWHTIYLGLQPK